MCSKIKSLSRSVPELIDSLQQIPYKIFINDDWIDEIACDFVNNLFTYSNSIVYTCLRVYENNKASTEFFSSLDLLIKKTFNELFSRIDKQDNVEIMLNDLNSDIHLIGPTVVESVEKSIEFFEKNGKFWGQKNYNLTIKVKRLISKVERKIEIFDLSQCSQLVIYDKFLNDCFINQSIDKQVMFIKCVKTLEKGHKKGTKTYYHRFTRPIEISESNERAEEVEQTRANIDEREMVVEPTRELNDEKEAVVRFNTVKRSFEFKCIESSELRPQNIEELEKKAISLTWSLVSSKGDKRKSDDFEIEQAKKKFRFTIEGNQCNVNFGFTFD